MERTDVDLDAPLPSERGICDLCESRPVAPDDCFCSECRAECEARSDEVPDPVERVLSAHGRMEPLCGEDQSVCRCGLVFSGGPGYHRRHTAEEVYKALVETFNWGHGGPLSWRFGAESASRERFRYNRIVPDAVGGQGD